MLKLIATIIVAALFSQMGFSQEICANEMAAQNSAQEQYSNALNTFNEEYPPDEEFQPDACLGGTVRWERTGFSLDIPEVTMARHGWSTKVPEVTMNTQRWVVKEVISKCEDKKIGQNPEQHCKDTWIKTDLPGGQLKTKGVPKCTTKWTDIITTVCWPETRDKEVKLDIPEISMRLRDFSWDVPEVTMSTREFSFHAPQFYTDSGCIGEDCADICEQELESEMAERDADRSNAIRGPQQQLLSSASKNFSCQRNNLNEQRTNAIKKYDSYINVGEATVSAFRTNNLFEEAEQQQDRVNEMIEARKVIADQLDAAIKSIDDAEQKFTAAFE